MRTVAILALILACLSLYLAYAAGREHESAIARIDAELATLERKVDHLYRLMHEIDMTAASAYNMAEAAWDVANVASGNKWDWVSGMTTDEIDSVLAGK